MEEEDEETLDTLRHTLLEDLIDSAYIGKSIIKKSNKLLNKANKDNFDVNEVEAIGLELLNMFNNVKGNMWAITDQLEKKLKKLNKNPIDGLLFKDLTAKVLEYKVHKILLGPDKKYVLTVPSHKDAQTNFPSTSCEDEVKTEILESSNEYESQEEPDTNCENKFINLKDVKGRNRTSLSLKKNNNNDTEDTDDGWVDSISGKSPSAMDLWNIRDQTADTIDDYTEKLKREQEEEELRNRKTPELNFATDGSDDTFIDGRTPKRKTSKHSDCESPAGNKEETDVEPDLIPKLDESFIVEESHLSYAVLDKTGNTNKSVSSGNTDDENDTSFADTSYDSNTDHISDSKKDKTVEDPQTREQLAEVELLVKTGSPNADSGVEVIPKPNNIPLESMDKIVDDVNESVIENMNIPNDHEIGKSESLHTEKCGSENSEPNSVETEMLDETIDERGPYSVETVKLDSDTEEVSGNETSENSDSEINMATQPVLNESMDLNVHTDQENKMIPSNNLDESFSSTSEEETELDSPKGTGDLTGSPNLITDEPCIKETETKDVSEIKESIENTSEKEPIVSPNLSPLNEKFNLHEDTNLSTDSPESNKDPADSVHLLVPSNLNLDNLDKTYDAEQSVESLNPHESDTKDVHSPVAESLSGTKELKLNEDKECVANRSSESPDFLKSDGEVSDAEQSLEDCAAKSPDFFKSDAKTCDADQSPEKCVARRSSKSPDLLKSGGEAPDPDQSPEECAANQFSQSPDFLQDVEAPGIDQSPDECAAKRSSESPDFLKADGEASDLEQSPDFLDPQLFDKKGNEDVNLSPNSPPSKSNEASDASQSENSRSLKGQSQMPDAKQAISSPDPQFSDQQVSNTDGENLTLPSKVGTCEVEQSSKSPLKSCDLEKLTPDEEMSLLQSSPASKDIASNSSQLVESPRVTSLQNNPDSQNLKSGENINVSPNSSAPENETPVGHLPTSDDKHNKISNPDTDAILFSDSDTIILVESDNEQDLDADNQSSLQNKMADIKNENLTAYESEETEKLSSDLGTDEAGPNKDTLTECNSHSDSDATDIYGHENEPIKQVINSSNDCSDNSKNKLESDGGKTLSQCSDKSFEFDITENLKEIAQNESSRNDKEPLISAEFENANKELDNRVIIGESDAMPLKNIVEDLEAVLAQQSENEGIGKNERDALKTTESRGAKETIDVSDSDDDDVHLDVVMEEILSDGSFSEPFVRKPDIEVKQEEEEEIQDIIPASPECTGSNENLPEKENTNDNSPDNGVGDELLELLREVELLTDVDDGKSKNKQGIDKEEAVDADEIFKRLQEESSLEISDSDLSEDEELKWESSDSELSELENDNEKSLDVESGIKETLPNKYNIKDCYVRIERLDFNEREVVKINKSLNDSIDRLCDINNIISKRKYSPSDPQEKLKKFKKAHKSTKKGTSDTESLSDISNSDTDIELRNDQTHSPILSELLEQKLDDLLANEICKALKSDSDVESADDESDDSGKDSKGNKNGEKNGETCDNDKKPKPILSKEEKERKAWKNDPLLREKLDSDSGTSTSGNKSESKRMKRLKRKYEHDTDFNTIISDSESDSDSDVYKQNKSWLEEQLISPIKKNLPLSGSDSDSDCEFVPQRPSPQKNPDDEAGPSASQKGRRNIRALMSDENLAEATQRANKEEQERIERLEDRHKVKESLSQSFSQTEDEDVLILDVDEKLGVPLITVNQTLTNRLKPHQRMGIQFMWDSCYESVDRLKEHDGSGCILAHCMGLGKTFQVITLIHTLFTHDVTNTKHVLVVCPVSTVNNWKNEVKIAFSDIPDKTLTVFTIAKQKELSRKYEIVKKWKLRKKCVLVLGYEGFETITNEVKLEKAGSYIKQRMLEALVDPGPDLVICDEGHLLRNKKALKTLALNKIKTKRRIVLTGTPLQNNLLEYYYMVQFVKPNLLGNIKEFKTNFVNPITNGQYEDSTEQDIKLMLKRTHVLHKLLKKTIQRIEDTELKIYLPKMVDHAVFIQLHQVQVDLYNKFSGIVRETSEMTNKKGFLSDYYVFQYIGSHPQLLAVMDNMRNKRIKERDLITNENENNNPVCNISGWWKAKVPEDAPEKIDYGNKLVVVKAILEECEEIGDKVLIFSQYLGELELIEHFLKKKGTTKCPSWQEKLDYFRMDGTVLPEERTIICDKFNEKGNDRMKLLLMSTKVGGLGLNLTAANRVIIMSVNWNPSFDTQSVFRVYRFGQEKEVYIYRLISLDTMEEKVYQRTVTKLAVAHRVVDKHQITRHYKSMDLQELYSSVPNADEERPIPNVPEDKILAKLLLKLPFIFKYHEHQALLANRPEDNLNEQELNAAWDEFKKIKDTPPVPPLPALPQLPLVTGPTYSNAYALKTFNRSRVMAGKEMNEDNLVQYYVPLPNPTNAQQAIRPVVTQMRNGNNGAKRKVNVPPSTVITLVDDSITEMIPLPLINNNNKESNVERDPLYISEKSGVGKTNGCYNRVMSYYAKKNPPLPKLDPSTSLFLENDSAKNRNQKENEALIRIPRLPDTSIIIEDEDQDRSKKIPKTVLTENKSAVNKRKRDFHNIDERIIKKMRETFNNSNCSINVDDDDEINDTCSESDSLSNEIIQNLGRSGITVHRVMKDSNRNNDIIMLD